MTDERHELSVPPDVEAHGGCEILRLFVTDGALSLTIQRAFAAPEMWGQLLAELARQIAEVYERETPICAEEALAEIRLALEVAFARCDMDGGGAIN